MIMLTFTKKPDLTHSPKIYFWKNHRGNQGHNIMGTLKSVFKSLLSPPIQCYEYMT